MNKSEFACRSNIRNMIGQLYLWTFTLTHQIELKKACQMWTRIAQPRLRYRLGFTGIRTFELHPGGHGLHVHVVTNKFFDVNRVRAVLTATPWGRVHVIAVDTNGAEYIAKYVTKNTSRPELKGIRIWASFGLTPGQRTRVQDISVISARGEAYHHLAFFRRPETASDRLKCMELAHIKYTQLTESRHKTLFARSILRTVDHILSHLSQADPDKYADILEAVSTLRTEAYQYGLKIDWSDDGESKIRKVSLVA